MDKVKEKVTLPLIRLKKCLQKPDVDIIFDVDENMYIAVKDSIIYGASTATFELKELNGRANI